MMVYMLSSAYSGCSYIRIQLPAYENGFDTDKDSIQSPKKSVDEIRQTVMGADVVVFHRPEENTYHDLARILKKDGKKVVMDNDDTFKLCNHPLANLTPDAKDKDVERRAKEIDNFAEIADLVTTTTKTLADEYKEKNSNTIILPNCIDPFQWDEPLKNKSKKIRIGLVGSATFGYDYGHVEDVLEELSDREDVQLFMFGLGDKKHRKENPNVTKTFKKDYEFWDSLDIEHQPWCPIHEYPQKLNEARLDIMLIPRQDNYFNRCKSNIKFLEASMCETPIIAQSFKDGPYEEIIHKENGVLVKNNDKWMEEINYLIDNPDKRKQIGKNAMKYTLKNYNIEDNAHLWDDAYKSLFI